MYAVYRVKDIVRIPPEMFGVPLEEAALKVLTDKYVGYVHPDMGIIVAVYNVRVSENGRLIPGDGATYHDAVYEVLAFKPRAKEVVEGTIVNAMNYGAWVNLGPVEGLVHISQMMDEHVRFDPQRKAFIGERTGRIIEIGDAVRARVMTVFMPMTGGKPRIQLTMRQPYLGKLEWIEKKGAVAKEAP